VTTPTDTNRDLITVIASMRAQAGKEDELRAILESMTEATKAEPGNVNYDLHQGLQDKAVFYFYENWESAGALGEHMKSPALQGAIGRVIPLLEGELSVVQLGRIA
jgi:quinol monooxygenase YgiN